DVPDYRQIEPHMAAMLLRQHWGLGIKPIANMVHLLELKGIRVFSLAESTKDVDAFSLWRDDIPYVFLNRFKSPERSRFDAAHEAALRHQAQVMDYCERDHQRIDQDWD